MTKGYTTQRNAESDTRGKSLGRNRKNCASTATLPPSKAKKVDRPKSNLRGANQLEQFEYIRSRLKREFREIDAMLKVAAQDRSQKVKPKTQHPAGKKQMVLPPKTAPAAMGTRTRCYTTRLKAGDKRLSPSPRRDAVKEADGNCRCKKTKEDEENRISRLGLGFVYMQQQTKKNEAARECASCRSHIGMESSSRARANETERPKDKRGKGKEVQKDAIREYMRRKKSAVESMRQDCRRRELVRREKINENKTRLEQMVKNIFRGTVSAKKPQKSQSRQLVYNAKKQEAARFVMDKIKFQLIRELADADKREQEQERTEPPIGEMKHSRSQPEIRRRRHPQANHQSRAGPRKRAAAAIKIQSAFKGFLARQRYRAFQEPIMPPHPQELAEDFAPSLSSESWSRDEPTVRRELKEVGVSAELEPTSYPKPESVPLAKKKPEFTFGPGESLSILPRKVVPVPASVPEQKQISVAVTKTGCNLRIETNLEQAEFVSPRPMAAKIEEKEVCEETKVPSPPKLEKEAENDSMEMLPPPRAASTFQSIFDHNAFNRFAMEKFGKSLDAVNLSKIVKIREEAIAYRERTEKKYIQRLYRKRLLTPGAYQSRRTELERWVVKEREEVKRTRSQMTDNWKRTTQMVEEAHINAMRIKKLFLQHAISYMSDSNSTISQPAETSRQNNTVVDSECDLTSAANEPVPGPAKSPAPTTGAIYIQENDSQPSTVRHLSPDDSAMGLANEGSVQAVLINPGSEHSSMRKESELIADGLIVAVTLGQIKDSYNESKAAAESKKELGEELTALLFEAVLKEATTQLFPKREPFVPKQISLQTLALANKKGSAADLYYINDYLDELFVEIFTEQKRLFLTDINKPITKSPIDTLSKLQNSDSSGSASASKPDCLPHEISPILPLDAYLEVEKGKEQSKPEDKSLSEGQQLAVESGHIHNKAIFDGANEALNLIRPYGLSGKPMPWSMQSRLLYTTIADPNIVVRNVKNIVLSMLKIADRCSTGQASRRGRCLRPISSLTASSTRNTSTK